MLQSFLHYLVEIVGVKLRGACYEARGVCVRFQYINGEQWYEKRIYPVPFYETEKIWYYVSKIFNRRPLENKVRHMEVYVYSVGPSLHNQLSLFEAYNRSEWITTACDDIRERYGINSIFSANALLGRLNIKQKIPFGSTEFFDNLIEEVE